MLAITGAEIVLENEIISGGTLLIEDGKILKFGAKDTVDVPNGAEIFDAKGLYLGPGLVDIHCHGGAKKWFYEDPKIAAQHHLINGTTTILPTLYTDMDVKKYIEAIELIKGYINDNTSSISGFYMEGPYTNPKYGASPEKNHWLGEIKAEEYTKIVEAAGKDAKVWVMAPEREGIEPFLQKANEANPNVVLSVGHSEATPEQVQRLKKYGISILTHCTNATGRLPVPNGTRSCGPDEACFLDDDMYAELICDSLGIHVNKDLIKLILKIKGKDKVILISDCTASADEVPAEFAHIKDLNFDAGGNLNGSTLTLNVACKNMMKHTGASINDVFLMASRNPARAVKMDSEIGSIEVGKKANLVIVDKDFNVKNVFLNGNLVR